MRRALSIWRGLGAKFGQKSVENHIFGLFFADLCYPHSKCPAPPSGSLLASGRGRIGPRRDARSFALLDLVPSGVGFWTGFWVHTVGIWPRNVAQKGPAGGGAPGLEDRAGPEKQSIKPRTYRNPDFVILSSPVPYRQATWPKTYFGCALEEVLRAFGPHILEWFLGPPGPPRPQISTIFDRPKNHVLKTLV